MIRNVSVSRTFLIATIFLLFATTEASTQDFESAFLPRYQKASAEQRVELLASLIQEQNARGGFPVRSNNGEVFFVYIGSGTENDVRIIGDFRPRSFFNVYWDQVGEPMIRAAENSPLFYKGMIFEKDARIDYKFVVDGVYLTDPLNPRTIVSGIAPVAQNETIATASELVLPGYILPDAIDERPDVPEGKLVTVDEPWANPKITIYLPSGYNSRQKYSVIYTADGNAWLNHIHLPVLLNNLIAEKRIKPLIAVMIDSIEDRRTWYYYNPEYLSYLEKVVEYVDAHYSTFGDPEARVHAGSSAGGSITLYVGFERPHLFRKVALLSPSLTGPPHYYEPYFTGRKKPHAELRIWMSAGKYEPYIHKDVLTMESYFRRVGLNPTISITSEGHSFGTWRRAAQLMLLNFFGS